MKISGFRLQQAIKVQVDRRKLAEARFDGSLKKFPDEKKPDPRDLMKEFEDAERQIALLQTAQARFNLTVEVEVQGKRMTLQEAVKLLGGASRVERNWTKAAAEENDRYADRVRDKDSIIAQRQVEPEKCAEFAKTAARKVRALRYAIQKGNATELDISGLDGLEIED